MNMQANIKRLDEQGYITLPFPNEIRRLIENTIIEKCNELSGQVFESIHDAQNYILNLPDEMFVKQFTKPVRSLPQNVTDQVFQWVEMNCKDLLNSDELFISTVPKWEAEAVEHVTEKSMSVYWRTVRPNKNTDVAGAHQDSTFWQIAHNLSYQPICPFKYSKRWKIWLPLFGCSQQNSLQMLPESHCMTVPDGIKVTEIGERPFIQPNWLHEMAERFVTPVFGENDHCVLFHDDLVHQGPVNKMNNVRFSAEFTILTGNCYSGS